MVEHRPERQQMSGSFPAKLRLHLSNLLRACGRPNESDGDKGPAISLLPVCSSLGKVPAARGWTASSLSARRDLSVLGCFPTLLFVSLASSRSLRPAPGLRTTLRASTSYK